jgi:hypothetical protein
MRAKEKKTDGIVQTTLKMQTRSVPDYSPCFEPCAAFFDQKLSSWPINLGDVTPIAWWRAMPADHIGEGPQLVLRALGPKDRTARQQKLPEIQRDVEPSTRREPPMISSCR